MAKARASLSAKTTTSSSAHPLQPLVLRLCQGHRRISRPRLSQAISACPSSIVRLFNTVGPRTGRNVRHGPAPLRRRRTKNKPIQVYGDGTQTRCFCHVSDVVDALVDVLTNTPNAVGQVFNLGSDEEISINDLAKRVITLCNSTSPIEYCPYEKAYGRALDDLPRRVPQSWKKFAPPSRSSRNSTSIRSFNQ